MLRFLTTLLGVKGKKQLQAVVQEIAQRDPASMSETQMIELERDLDKAGALFGRLQTDYQREEKEAKDAEGQYNLTVAGAEELERQYNAAPDGSAEKVALHTAFSKLLGRLEEVQIIANREREEAQEAKAILDEAEQVYREKAQQLVAAKEALKKGARNMERANMRAETEERRAEIAAQMAGLRDNDSNSLNAAITAFDKSANKANERAAAARVKAEELKRAKLGTTDGDPLIAQAMKQVAGRTSSTLPPSERLAQLTGRSPATPALALPTPVEQEKSPNA